MARARARLHGGEVGSEVQGALRTLAAVLHDGRSSHLRHDRERGDEAGGDAVRGKGEHGDRS